MQTMYKASPEPIASRSTLMEMTGEYRIAAPREQVWAALNNPEILREAIPGCEELKAHSPTELEAAAKAKIGPVSARFKGKVVLSNLNPPESYTLTGEGTGGAAGFAKGEAQVTLVPDGGETILRYAVKASVGGKLAQVGQRLIDGAARKMADEFFDRFASLAGGKVEPEATDTPSPAPVTQAQSGFEPAPWVPLAVVGGAILFMLVLLLS
jgi:carbon monoxide dehydrogenase subunit G